MDGSNTHHDSQELEIAILKERVAVLESGWHDALESNFRAQSLLTDSEGLVSILLNLQKQFPNTPTAVAEARDLLRDLCDLQRQVTFTGRCIAGVFRPNASLFTDQRIKQSTVGGLTAILVDTSNPSCEPT
jgi:hypothetical protein